MREELTGGTIIVVWEFDREKDAANVVKHGISLARAADLRVEVSLKGSRYAEPRFRAYGLLDGLPYCIAYAIRGERLRAISLRRAHLKEFRRNVS